MKKLAAAVVCILCPIIINAQSLKGWEGDYSGTIKATQLNGKVSEFSMKLSIHHVKDEVYDWIITYGDSGKDVRSYQMIQIEGNEYQLDEKNGIFIQTSKIGNEMIALFELKSSYIFVSYSLLEGAIGVKITSASHREESGGSMDPDGEVIPNVASFLTSVSQSAYLKRE